MTEATWLERLQQLKAVHQADHCSGKGVKVGIVASQYNDVLVDDLLEQALHTLIEEHQVAAQDIQVYRVPGAFEIPLMAQSIAARFDTLIALACVIRGRTVHFDHVVAACRHGIMEVMLKTKKPIAYGVLAVENQLQAEQRSQAGDMSRGAEAARAALVMHELMKSHD